MRVWSAHDEFMHVYDCIMSVCQSAWFGIFFAAALKCAKHGLTRDCDGKLFAAQKPSVCGSSVLDSEAIQTVFREMCDNLTVRMCDSGTKPSLTRFAYRSVVNNTKTSNFGDLGCVHVASLVAGQARNPHHAVVIAGLYVRSSAAADSY